MPLVLLAVEDDDLGGRLGPLRCKRGVIRKVEVLFGGLSILSIETEAVEDSHQRHRDEPPHQSTSLTLFSLATGHDTRRGRGEVKARVSARAPPPTPFSDSLLSPGPRLSYRTWWSRRADRSS